METRTSHIVYCLNPYYTGILYTRQMNPLNWKSDDGLNPYYTGILYTR